jgi:hypothetical protein
MAPVLSCRAISSAGASGKNAFLHRHAAQLLKVTGNFIVMMK